MKHGLLLTNPSKRYCIKCLEIIYVNYPTNVVVKCLKCSTDYENDLNTSLNKLEL